MKRFFVLATVSVALWFPLATAGQSPLVVTDSGYYLLTSDSKGSPQLKKIIHVIDMTGGDIHIDPPVVDPDDPPAPVDLVRDQVSQWSLQIGDFDNSQAIALVYERMQQSLDKGDLTAENVWEAAKVMTDTLLKSSNSEPAWSPFRGKLTSLIRNQTAQGKLKTVAQVSAFFESIKNGLRDSVPEDAAELPLSDGLQVIEACEKTIARLGGR